MQLSSDQARIFVSIASFCDPMLAFTVRSAVETARYPARLSFGIVDQSAASAEAALPAGDWRSAYLHIDPHHSRGACWARALAMTLHAGEDYLFQVDSHSCFDPGWDATLIQALEATSARSGNHRSILSVRPFAFEIDEAGAVLTRRFTRSTMRLVRQQPQLNLADPVMSFDCTDSGSTEDQPGYQISAAYLFTRGTFVEEVPYDPFLYFHGEEQNLSIRAFTHGWDIWHPNAVPLYHLYKKRAEGEAPLHWDPQFEERRREKWPQLRDRATARLADLIAGRLAGAYGLGASRSIDAYLRFAGLTLEQAA